MNTTSGGSLPSLSCHDAIHKHLQFRMAQRIQAHHLSASFQCRPPRNMPVRRHDHGLTLPPPPPPPPQVQLRRWACHSGGGPELPAAGASRWVHAACPAGPGRALHQALQRLNDPGPGSPALVPASERVNCSACLQRRPLHGLKSPSMLLVAVKQLLRTDAGTSQTSRTEGWGITVPQNCNILRLRKCRDVSAT